uniref:BRCT domain-containing protein n=1 Tax=Plectus sambesii TaxID=2011161 RepID=A0A914UR65_9BILA
MPNKAEKRKLEPQPAPVEAEAQKQPERVAEYKRILIANCQDDLKRKAISRAIERVDHFSLNLISSDFVNAATHIVAVSLSPTEKIFGAIAAGIWLLRIDWVTQSWRHNRVWQPEDRFSFDSDPTTIRDDAKSLVAAWRRNFERRRRNEPKVFAVDSFKAVAVLSADSPVHRRIVESARRILFAGGAHCKRGVTAANVSHPAVHSSLSLVLVVDNENEAPLLKPSVVQTLLSAGIPVLSCDEIKTIIIHDAPRHLRTLLNLSIDYWSNRFNTVHGKAAYPLFCHKFEPPSQKGATTMSAAPHVIDLIDTSISPEKSSTHYNYNDMIDLASS